MSSPFNKRAVAADVALALANDIKGKNSEQPSPYAYPYRDLSGSCGVIVFITGATVGSLGGEFVKAVAPYADTIWVAGRAPER